MTEDDSTPALLPADASLGRPRCRRSDARVCPFSPPVMALRSHNGHARHPAILDHYWLSHHRARSFSTLQYHAWHGSLICTVLFSPVVQNSALSLSLQLHMLLNGFTLIIYV
ncbi:hypothetical protein FB567DRAFT_549973 [Paraphoma chrysanthemicola]|uniref:Uncharacterized protein n=1 Tax=Paraphoma chrysanthemicola TaxID=798071 RepID=A0A8K0VXU7_9PLEO|nr:hypothetical protein FB567DRAFT_549973 [Paraphoma chrysanthemicola]